MRIVKTPLCETVFRFTEIEIDKDLLLKSRTLEVLRKQYGFSNLNESEAEEKSVALEGGRYRDKKSGEYIVDRLAIGNVGFFVRLWGPSAICHEMLDEVCKTIDQQRIFPFSVSTAKREVQHETVVKVNLNFPPFRLLSTQMNQFLESLVPLFRTEQFSVEIHPVGVITNFMIWPEVGESAADKSTPRHHTLRRSARSRKFYLAFEDIDDFYNGVYLVRAELEYSTLLSKLKQLESMLQESKP